VSVITKGTHPLKFVIVVVRMSTAGVALTYQYSQLHISLQTHVIFTHAHALGMFMYFVLYFSELAVTGNPAVHTVQTH
jgi:hypothetical protein